MNRLIRQYRNGDRVMSQPIIHEAVPDKEIRPGSRITVIADSIGIRASQRRQLELNIIGKMIASFSRLVQNSKALELHFRVFYANLLFRCSLHTQ